MLRFDYVRMVAVDLPLNALSVIICVGNAISNKFRPKTYDTYLVNSSRPSFWKDRGYLAYRVSIQCCCDFVFDTIANLYVLVLNYPLAFNM